MREVLREAARERERERLLRERTLPRGDIGGQSCARPLFRSVLPRGPRKRRAGGQEGMRPVAPPAAAVSNSAGWPTLPAETARQCLRDMAVRRQRWRQELERSVGRGDLG